MNLTHQCLCTDTYLRSTYVVSASNAAKVQALLVLSSMWRWYCRQLEKWMKHKLAVFFSIDKFLHFKTVFYRAQKVLFARKDSFIFKRCFFLQQKMTFSDVHQNASFEQNKSIF